MFFIFLEKINDRTIINKKIEEIKISVIPTSFINQEEVIRRIKPRKYLKFIIQVPGVGTNLKKLGYSKTKKYGKENPRAINRKIISMFMLDVIAEKPIAVPKKGALQGVAINVANIPDKKRPLLLFDDEILFNLLSNLWGSSISKKPNKFKAKIKIIEVIVNKK